MWWLDWRLPTPRRFRQTTGRRCGSHAQLAPPLAHELCFSATAHGLPATSGRRRDPAQLAGVRTAVGDLPERAVGRALSRPGSLDPMEVGLVGGVR